MGFRVPPPPVARQALQAFWTCDHCGSLQPMSRWSCAQCGGPYSSPAAAETEFLPQQSVNDMVRVATALQGGRGRAWTDETKWY